MTKKKKSHQKFLGDRWEIKKSEILFGRRFLPSAIAFSRLWRLIPISPPKQKIPAPLAPPNKKILEPPLSKTWLLRIARAKKPHTIAEDLLLPATKDIVSCSDLNFTS